jgi:hypothetical protein
MSPAWLAVGPGAAAEQRQDLIAPLRAPAVRGYEE